MKMKLAKELFLYVVSYCRYRIYWVGVNTKYCKFCIYAHSVNVVNAVFTPTQLIQNLQFDSRIP